jgi:cob(I)alamin adenosyltransferase
VYHGNGKGKTTAALGLAIRAAGQGKKVGIVYFDKGGSNYGERKLLPLLAPRIDFWVTGLVRFVPGKPFRFGVIDGDKEEGTRGLDIVRGLFKKKYDLIIMDEINSTAGLKIVDEQAVLDLLDQKPKYTEVVMTGRNCPQSFIDRADLVTEMHLIKHYFYKGIPAREGIEF